MGRRLRESGAGRLGALFPLPELLRERAVGAVGFVGKAEVVVDLEEGLLLVEPFPCRSLGSGGEKALAGAAHLMVVELRAEFAVEIPERGLGGEAGGDDKVGEDVGDAGFADEEHWPRGGLGVESVVVAP